MTETENGLVRCMEATMQLLAMRKIDRAKELSDGLLSVALAELQGRVLAARCERGDVSALDEAAANVGAFQSIGGMLQGICPDCGCEFTEGCFTCERKIEADASDKGVHDANHQSN